MAAVDKVYIRDKKDGSVKNMNGTLVFSPTGLQLVGADKKVLAILTPAEVVKVVPVDLPGVDSGEMFKYIGLEDKKTKADFVTARLGYQDMKKKAAAAPERTKRYIDFKLALMTSRIAEETGYDEDWSKVALEAAKEWSDFIDVYKTGFDVWVAARASARIYTELNKFNDVARIWNRMTKKEVNLPPDLLFEAQLQEIDAQIRSKAGAAAQVAAAALLNTAPAASKDKVAIYEAAAKAMAGGEPLTGVKAIEAKIAGTKDSATRGIGFSMLGELYQEAPGRSRDAMWNFLWVETVYNADKEDAFKAMCRLVEVFKSQMDDDRVRAYQDKLRRARGNF